MNNENNDDVIRFAESLGSRIWPNTALQREHIMDRSQRRRIWQRPIFSAPVWLRTVAVGAIGLVLLGSFAVAVTLRGHHGQTPVAIVSTSPSPSATTSPIISATSPSPTIKPPAHTPAPPIANCTASDIWFFTTTDAPSYLMSVPVHVTTHLRNVSSRPCNFAVGGCQQTYIVDGRGNSIASNLAYSALPRNCPAAMYQLLQSGQELTTSYTWNQVAQAGYCQGLPSCESGSQAPAGDYRALASWTGANQKSAAASFSIVEPPECSEAGIALSAKTDASTYHLGQTINFTYVERNASVKICRISFNCNQQIQLKDASGTVYSVPVILGCAAAYPGFTVLRPGASVTDLFAWDQKAWTTNQGNDEQVPIGRYQMYAVTEFGFTPPLWITIIP